jgi:molecular chaperone GrpE (heat shock protein)
MYGNVVFDAKFHTIAKKRKLIHVAYSLFLKKLLPNFENIENILSHLDTERKEKKRKGWDIILHILDTVKLVLHT